MSLKSAVLRSKLMNSDCFFFRALRRIAFFLLGNIIHNSRMSHSFLRKSRFRCGTNNHVRIGREGIIKHLNLLINGKNNHITIGDGFIVNDGLQIEIVGDGNTITLGEKTIFIKAFPKL